jgi:hypothetical protein
MGGENLMENSSDEAIIEGGGEHGGEHHSN